MPTSALPEANALTNWSTNLKPEPANGAALVGRSVSRLLRPRRWIAIGMVAGAILLILPSTSSSETTSSAETTGSWDPCQMEPTAPPPSPADVVGMDQSCDEQVVTAVENSADRWAPYIFPGSAVLNLPGFKSTVFPANDDGSTAKIDLGFDLRYAGTTYNGLYVNNNGNVTLDLPLPEWTPEPLGGLDRRILAPFWADVDTRGAGSSLVTYGFDIVDGRRAFGVNWIDVGYYAQHAESLNSFQLIIVDRNNNAPGNFEFQFRYNKVNWEAGDASGGSAGLGGQAARAGYGAGRARHEDAFEIPGSGIPGGYLDANRVTGLIYNHSNSNTNGAYIFHVRGGVVYGGRPAACPTGQTCLTTGRNCKTDFLYAEPRRDTGTVSKAIFATLPFVLEGASASMRRVTDVDVCVYQIGWHMNRYLEGNQPGQVTIWSHAVCDGSRTSSGDNCVDMRPGGFSNSETHKIEDYPDNSRVGNFRYPSNYYYGLRAFWEVHDNIGPGAAMGCYPTPDCRTAAEEPW